MLKKTLFCAFTLLAQINLAQDLSGAWKGYATQEEGAIRSHYPFEMNLLEGKKNIWKGGSYFYFPDRPEIFVTYSMNLQKQGSEYIYNESEILRQFSDIKGLEFCIKTATLSLSEDKDSLYLRGKWTGSTSSNICSPGTFYLAKTKTKPVSTVPQSKENPIIPSQLPETVKKGDTFVMNTIFFKPDQASLSSESSAELERLIHFLKAQPRLKVEIIGHTDNGGNIPLSEKRAEAVRDYLVTRGIAHSRLKTKGMGATKPIADNATIEGRKKNRRTEFLIIAD